MDGNESVREMYKRMFGQASVDQQEAGMIQIAGLAATLYRELVGRGTPEDLAAGLVIEWFTMIIHKSLYPDQPPNISRQE